MLHVLGGFLDFLTHAVRTTTVVIHTTFANDSDAFAWCNGQLRTAVRPRDIIDRAGKRDDDATGRGHREEKQEHPHVEDSRCHVHDFPVICNAFKRFTSKSGQRAARAKGRDFTSMAKAGDIRILTFCAHDFLVPATTRPVVLSSTQKKTR